MEALGLDHRLSPPGLEDDAGCSRSPEFLACKLVT